MRSKANLSSSSSQLAQSTGISMKVTSRTAPISSKKDKRLRKHSDFLSRIEKPSKKNISKRRRPSKKLVATLDELLEALPKNDDVLVGGASDENEGKLKLKSLNTRPGALKRKARLEREEKTRFDKNLAQIFNIGQSAAPSNPALPNHGMTVDLNMRHTSSSSTLVAPESNVTATRFAAIRAWASSNMGLHPDFKRTS